MGSGHATSPPAGRRRAGPPTVTDTDRAVATIRNGDTVFVASAAATPEPLLEALYRRAAQLTDLTLLHFVTNGVIPSGHESFMSPFAHRTLFVGSEMRTLMDRGASVEYVPLSIAQVPGLVRAGRLRPDVALVQTTRPDARGFARYGVGVDIADCMIDAARVVIAEANARMPAAQGETAVAVDRFDYVVETDRPIPEYFHAAADDVTRRVAAYIGSLIDDGSTLQIGLGQIPNEALRFLTMRNHLGIHSDVITDPLIDLMDAGVVDGSAKTDHRGVVVASYCVGSQRLYDRIDGNAAFSFQPIDRVCAPAVIAAQHRMVSLTQVFSIDLTGQACADQFDGRLYGGVSAQPDLLRATAAAPHGKPVICLASTTPDLRTSRVRPLLPAGEGVTVARYDVHFVVTEFGIANLFGKSIPERALALIELAHPSFRPWLLDEAKRLGYLRSQQTLAATGAYPVEEERRLLLRDDSAVAVRPAKASDGERIRTLFHEMSEDDIYTRFFSRLSCLSFGDMQRLCNVDYASEVAFVVTAEADPGGPLIATASYYLTGTGGTAEVAYMTHPQWQGRGLGRMLQQLLFEYGKRHGVHRFVAEVLRSNGRMARLARSACTDVEVESDGDVLTIVMVP